jgi:hypothetical protein
MLTEKRCKKCNIVKEITEFHWKSKRRGTRQINCIACTREYGHTHYLANSQEYKDRANTRLKALRTENRDLLKTYISTHPCSKCGETNYKVLSTNLNSNEINNLATPELQAKLQVCTILCRNCEANQDL